MSPLRRRGKLWALRACTVAAVLALLASCTSHQPGGPVSLDTKPAPSGSSSADATYLIGNWQLVTPSQRSPVIVQFDLGRIATYQACGQIGGVWRSTYDGHIATNIDQASDTCYHALGETILNPTWLPHVGTFSASGGTLTLFAANGDVKARLRAVSASIANPAGGPLPSLRAMPSPSTAFILIPPTLPSGVDPATAAELLGDWATKSKPTAKAGAKFKADGTWTGSDGCNGGGGSWVLSADGQFAGTTGASTLIGCQNIDVPNWIGSATRVGISGGHLEFFDVTGKLLGTLMRRG